MKLAHYLICKLANWFYSYTEIGELKTDEQEEIEEIIWRVDSKVKEVRRSTGSTRKNLKFDYDAMGNRIAKHTYEINNTTLVKSTYYVRDAQGNVISVYEHTVDNTAQTLDYKLAEQHIYGSSRLGMNTKETSMLSTVTAQAYSRELGLKQYELSNHLGNVLTVITDKKIPVDDNTDQTVDYYVVEILTATDYSPFGVTLENRDFTSEKYRYGFNGMEKDDEVSGKGNSYNAMHWQYDTRLGKRWQLDPILKEWESPYACFSNNPVFFSDPSGLSSEPPAPSDPYGESTATSSGTSVVAYFDEKDNNKVTYVSQTTYTQNVYTSEDNLSVAQGMAQAKADYTKADASIAQLTAINKSAPITRTYNVVSKLTLEFDEDGNVKSGTLTRHVYLVGGVQTYVFSVEEVYPEKFVPEYKWDRVKSISRSGTVGVEGQALVSNTEVPIDSKNIPDFKELSALALKDISVRKQTGGSRNLRGWLDTEMLNKKFDEVITLNNKGTLISTSDAAAVAEEINPLLINGFKVMPVVGLILEICEKAGEEQKAAEMAKKLEWIKNYINENGNKSDEGYSTFKLEK